VDRVVIVTKPTRLEELVDEHMNEGVAAFVLDSHGQSIAPYQEEDARYRRALDTVRQSIPNDLMTAILPRAEIPQFMFRETDLVIPCGPDGLFVNVAQYVDRQLVLGVNPDPASVTGKLMTFSPHQVRNVIERIRKGEYGVDALPFAKAVIDNDRTVWGLNDIFIGRSDQVSARYTITFGMRSEHQSSSGVIVSTGVGASGWMRAIQAMFEGLSDEVEPSYALSRLPSPVEPELVFVVREPFPTPTTGVSVVTGRVVPGGALELVCEMSKGGVIFSDGIVERAVPWGAGSTVVITVGDRTLRRVAH
jgi:NAD kinase